MAIAIPVSELEVLSKENLPKAEEDYAAGAVLLIDKPKGLSSFDIIRKVRKALDMKKVGHAGTLDPMATGLLVLCVGRATKSISQIQDMPKTYIGKLTFGHSTPSFDAETEFDGTAGYEHITQDKLEELLVSKFTGDIEQVPPMYSALKRGGQRLYKKARKGETVYLPPRPVVIHRIEILEFNLPHVILEIECSKGTYIRSVANDLGKELDSLAYLSALRRTKTGIFDVEQALNTDELL